MSDKDIKKLEEKISELQKEVDLLRKVKDLEGEIKRLMERPVVIPYIPYYPTYPQYPYSPITWTSLGSEIGTATTYTYKSNCNDQISLTGSN